MPRCGRSMFIDDTRSLKPITTMLTRGCFSTAPRSSITSSTMALMKDMPTLGACLEQVCLYENVCMRGDEDSLENSLRVMKHTT